MQGGYYCQLVLYPGLSGRAIWHDSSKFGAPKNRAILAIVPLRLFQKLGRNICFIFQYEKLRQPQYMVPKF